MTPTLLTVVFAAFLSGDPATTDDRRRASRTRWPRACRC